MEAPELNNLTEEQIKDISKILSQARWRLSWIAIKFSVGLLSANLLCLTIAFFFFTDANLEMLKGFEFVTMVLNFLFMASYLSGQMRKNHDIVSAGIKEVLKNKSE